MNKKYYLVNVKYENGAELKQICQDNCNLKYQEFIDRCIAWYEENDNEFSPAVISITAAEYDFGFSIG